jgi:betaine reductase
VSEFDFSNKRVIALGERDGVAGPAMAAVAEASGGSVVFSATECFV